jgi:membrane protein
LNAGTAQAPVAGPSSRSAQALAAAVAARIRTTPPGAIAKAVRMGRSVADAETRTTRAAAVTLVQAGRTAVAADRYVRRHPWSSVLLAAGAAMLVAAVAGRRDDGER